MERKLLNSIQISRDLKMNDFYLKALSFYNLIRYEIKNCAQLYGKEDIKTLRDYYPIILTHELYSPPCKKQ